MPNKLALRAVPAAHAALRELCRESRGRDTRMAMLSSRTLDDHIELTPSTVRGRPRIRRRRIAVQDIAIWHERRDKSADDIAGEYDQAGFTGS
jgi:uncharacterized protein (DUF433 family)